MQPPFVRQFNRALQQLTVVLGSRATIVVPTMAALLALYWLTPRFMFKGQESISTSDAEAVRQFVQDLNTSISPPPTSVAAAKSSPRFTPTCAYCTDYREISLGLTPLVRVLVKIPIQVYGDQSIPAIGTPEYYAMVRADNVILLFLLVFGLVLGLRAARSVPTTVWASSTSGRSKTAGHHTAEAFLEADVLKAEERARDVYRRSTILLAGGIVMAFVGVALFYFTLPQASTAGSDERAEIEYLRFQQYQIREYLENPRNDDRYRPVFVPSSHEDHPWLNFASHSLRPTGMLIFMEGIAWFLLRQYRVLIEEYKSFLRTYLRRSNYLVAWKATTDPEKQFTIALEMTKDDGTGTLKKGETTEALEVMRIGDPAPIVEVLREVKSLVQPLLARKANPSAAD